MSFTSRSQACQRSAPFIEPSLKPQKSGIKKSLQRPSLAHRHSLVRNELHAARCMHRQQVHVMNCAKAVFTRMASFSSGRMPISWRMLWARCRCSSADMGAAAPAVSAVCISCTRVAPFSQIGISHRCKAPVQSGSLRILAFTSHCSMLG